MSSPTTTPVQNDAGDVGQMYGTSIDGMMMDEIWRDVFFGLPVAVVAVITADPSLAVVFVENVVMEEGAGDAIRCANDNELSGNRLGTISRSCDGDFWVLPLYKFLAC